MFLMNILTILTENAGWVDSVLQIITLIITGLGLVSGLITTGVKLYNALKEIKQNKNWAKIVRAIWAAVEEAEKTGKSGAEKKAIVVATINEFMAGLGITYDAQAISDYIDEVIEFFNAMQDSTKIGKKNAKALKSAE